MQKEPATPAAGDGEEAVETKKEEQQETPVVKEQQVDAEVATEAVEESEKKGKKTNANLLCLIDNSTLTLIELQQTMFPHLKSPATLLSPSSFPRPNQLWPMWLWRSAPRRSRSLRKQWRRNRWRRRGLLRSQPLTWTWTRQKALSQRARPLSRERRRSRRCRWMSPWRTSRESGGELNTVH